MSTPIDEPRPRQFRVSLAHMVFAEIQVEATSASVARELALQRKAEATRKLVAEPFTYRTEIIERVVDGQPLWTEVR